MNTKIGLREDEQGPFTGRISVQFISRKNKKNQLALTSDYSFRCSEIWQEPYP
jgi:hypothetical protein